MSIRTSFKIRTGIHGNPNELTNRTSVSSNLVSRDLNDVKEPEAQKKKKRTVQFEEPVKAESYSRKPRRYSVGWGSKPTSQRTSGQSSKSNDATYDQIKAKCIEEGKLYEDPEFPANASSLKVDSGPYEWKRPQEIVGSSGTPEFFVGGVSRFDIQQGSLGDCWLLAALACLGQRPYLLARVIPQGQNFKPGSYAGIFRFNIWWFGQWTEVIIDDRLPTRQDGQLVFMRSSTGNEFWSPLLEKAYAKLNGSYQALEAGQAIEAFEDFTGGLAEFFKLDSNLPPNFWNILLKAEERDALMSCSITGSVEGELPNGLVTGHAYSITGIREIRTRTGSDKVDLMRIRNPWGKVEWKGAWSDRSPEWTNISDAEKKEIGLVVEEDGEFWISFQEFLRSYTIVQICNLDVDSLTELDPDKRKKRWVLTKYEGSWIRGVSAGGCTDNKATFHTNPQYHFEVPQSDTNESETAIIAVMQKERRKKQKKNVSLGIAVYQLGDDEVNETVGREFFSSHRPVFDTQTFRMEREVVMRLSLSKGSYLVMPTTMNPNEEAEFVLRIYTETPITSRELDEETSLESPRKQKLELEENLRRRKSILPGSSAAPEAATNGPTPDLEPTTENAAPTLDEFIGEETARDLFKQVAGEDLEVDAYELQNILNTIFKKEMKFDGFSEETCRSIVALKDFDLSGKLGFTEFEEFISQLIVWTLVFKSYEDENGHISSFHVREILRDIGFRVSNRTFSALVQRYSHRDGKIYFDDYIHAITRLTTMFELFKEMTADNGKAQFNLDEFVQTTMYS